MDAKTNLIQNLHDAGCCEEQIEEFLSCAYKYGIEEQIKLLRRYRVSLMDEMHESQRRVDCLDFLVNKLRRELKEGNKS